MPVSVKFLLAALATWRVAFLLVREDGPGGVLANIRRRLGGGLLRELFGCVKCIGMWVAIPFTFFVVQDGFAALGVTWLALSGVTALIDEWLRPPFEWREEKDSGLLREDRDRSPD
jgi:hypothetical protein